MSRKNAILPFHLVSAQSLLADFESQETNIQFQDNVGITFSTSGSDVTGQFYVQVFDGVDWFDIEVSPDITISGADAKMVCYLNQLPFQKIRVRFEFGSGTAGTVDVWLTSKMI